MSDVRGLLMALLVAALAPALDAQVFTDGGFESQAAGSPPAAPWTVASGASHIVRNTADCGMPSEGSRYLEASANGTGPGTPPAPTTGFGTAASGTGQVTQTFAGPALVTGALVFINGEGAASSTYNDFACVEVSALGQSYSLAYLDTYSAMTGTSGLHSANPCTAVTAFTADLVTLFPAATGATVFTLRLHASNRGDGVVPSFAYLDNIVVGTPPPPPLASDFENLGGGLWRLNVTSLTPGVELYNLVGVTVLANPVGSGSFLGMAPAQELFVEATFPIGTDPFHVSMAGTTYQSPAYPIPAGLVVDEVTIAVQGFTVVGYTNAQRFTF